jgi:hypothetical protein
VPSSEGFAWRPVNRFQFRLFQLRHLGCDGKSHRVFLEEKIAAAKSLQRTNPGAARVERVWNNKDHFGENIFRFASIELRGNYLGEGRSDLVELLWFVARVFDELKELSNAILGFRLLMDLDPARKSEYLIEYIRTSFEHREFTDRKLRILLARSGLVAAASAIWDQFRPIIDQNLERHFAAERLSQSGQTAQDFDNAVQILRQALPKAGELARKGSCQEAVALFEPSIQPPFCSSRSWILLDHLRALDLRLFCGQQLGEDRRLLARRAAQLREMTVDFIYQISKTVNSPEMKEIAQMLAASASASPRNPLETY